MLAPRSLHHHQFLHHAIRTDLHGDSEIGVEATRGPGIGQALKPVGLIGEDLVHKRHAHTELVGLGLHPEWPSPHFAEAEGFRMLRIGRYCTDQFAGTLGLIPRVFELAPSSSRVKGESEPRSAPRVSTGLKLKALRSESWSEVVSST